MRLIDADALIKRMKSHTVKDNGLTDDYKAGLTDSIRTAVALAESASTIDAVPVVRGGWVTTRTIIHDGAPYCFLCGQEALAEYGRHTYIKSKYCPNCGAKMSIKWEGSL